MIKELRDVFDGMGEVGGYRFVLEDRDGYAYVYRVELIVDPSCYHYEVFERRVNDVYGCVKYPRSKAFGDWAFCYRRGERDLAFIKFRELSNRVRDRLALR